MKMRVTNSDLLKLFLFLFSVLGVYIVTIPNISAAGFSKNISKVTTKSYSNSGHSVTFNIPNLVSYGNVYSNNNGNVSSTRSGDNVTVSVRNGSIAGYDVKETSTNYYNTSYPSDSIFYSESGWSGTLSRGYVTTVPVTTTVSSGYYQEDGYYKTVEDKTYGIIGYEQRCHNSDWSHDHGGECDYTHNTAYDAPIYGWKVTGSHDEWVSTGSHWVDTTHDVTVNYYSTTYSGTVSKPYYQYTVTMDYIANRPPEISMSLDNMYYSEVENYNEINIQGKIRDVDTSPTPDNAILKYSIFDSNGNALPYFKDIDLGSYSGSNSWSTFSKIVPIDNNLLDGKYKLVVSAVDRENEKTTYTSDFYVDRDKPNTPEIHLSKEGWTIPTVTFTITDKGDNGISGISKIEYQINNDGKWIKYSDGQTIPIPSNLKGEIPVKARAVDKSGNTSDINLSNVYIDNIAPKIESFKVITLDDGTQKLAIHAKDNETAIKDSGYKYYVKQEGIDDDFKPLTDWTSDTEIELPKEPFGSEFSYYVEVRDLNDNIAKSRVIHYVTPPKLKFIGVKKDDFDNTVTIEFERNYTNGPVIEIYREGELVSVLQEGSTYVDENLDYDREYNYKFITVVGEGEDRVESMPIKSKVSIGKPTLEMKLDSTKYYTTPFTDTYNITGKLTYRKGGKVAVKLFDDSDEQTEINRLSLDLTPYIKTSWKISGEHTTDNSKDVYITGDLVNAEFSGLYKRKFSANVSKKNVTVKNISDYSKYSIYK